MVLKLASKAQAQLVVVIKAPRAKHLNVMSLLTIYRKQDRKLRTEKLLANEVSRRMVPVTNELRVALVGRLQNPQLFCCRSVFEDKANEFVIPLIVKKSEPV